MHGTEHHVMVGASLLTAIGKNGGPRCCKRDSYLAIIEAVGFTKIAFICVHNSCRSQMAEAFGKEYLSEKYDCYSAGTETRPQINDDALRIMKEHFGIDMSG